MQFITIHKTRPLNLINYQFNFIPSPSLSLRNYRKLPYIRIVKSIKSDRASIIDLPLPRSRSFNDNQAGFAPFRIPFWRAKNRAKFHSPAENSAWQFPTNSSSDVRVSARRCGVLFEADATLFSAPGIPGPSPSSSARGSLRRNAEEFARKFHPGIRFPGITLFPPSLPIRGEVGGASFHSLFSFLQFETATM